MRRPCRKRCGAAPRRSHWCFTCLVVDRAARGGAAFEFVFKKNGGGSESIFCDDSNGAYMPHMFESVATSLVVRSGHAVRSVYAASGGAARGQRESSSSPLLHHAGSAGVCTSWMSSNPHILHSPKRACIDVYAPSFSGLDSQPRPTLASSGRRGGERRRTERASRVPP